MNKIFFKFMEGKKCFNINSDYILKIEIIMPRPLTVDRTIPLQEAARRLMQKMILRHKEIDSATDNSTTAVCSKEQALPKRQKQK